jgi:hypothetical protein
MLDLYDGNGSSLDRNGRTDPAGVTPSGWR